MEEQSYISCIKINGVPILPPMMSKNVKEEMNRYKQLALAVEKRLLTLRIAKLNANSSTTVYTGQSDPMPFENNQKTSPCRLDSNFVPYKTEDGGLYEPNREMSVNNHDDDDDLKRTSQWSTDSDGENISEDVTCLTRSPVPRLESRSTDNDSNRSLNGTASSKYSTGEITPETTKPQVPTTLNIVPLTLDVSEHRTDEEDSRMKLEDSRNTPKLVRQGSYILETPSPMLVAHMQAELANATSISNMEYIPTPTTNTVRRKEWNIAQAKIEWKHRSRDNEYISSNSPTNISNVYNENSRSDCKIRKSISLQAKRESGTLNEKSPSARSVDCIPAMLTKEYLGTKNIKGNHDRKFPDEDIAEGNKDGLQNWKRHGNCFVEKFARKLGGSLGNLNGDDLSFLEYPKIDCNDKHLTNGNVKEETSNNKEIEDSTIKLKSSITSEKLLTVYKEVQEVHKKQMAELMFRQQREQTLLQKEFEKQQLLLLTEIKKTFPEITIPLLSESPSPISENFSSNDERQSECNDTNGYSQENRSTKVEPKRDKASTRDSRDSRARTIISCPLDYIYSTGGALVETESSNREDKFSRTTERYKEETVSCVSHGKTKKSEGKSKGVSEQKRLSFNRQLFPLESKTTHVPILDGTIYETKHIRAAIVINAYARGYLVRRMMRTKHVIALKNTYREALHCMLKLHIDAPLNRSEFNFLHRLQLQCDAASMNIVELFAQSSDKRMQLIAQDHEMKRSQTERPMSARSYSFATQRTLARKKLKEMKDYQPTTPALSYSARSRCQTWTSDVKEKLISPNSLHQSIKRSTSAGTVRKPWR